MVCTHIRAELDVINVEKTQRNVRVGISHATAAGKDNVVWTDYYTFYGITYIIIQQ